MKIGILTYTSNFNFGTFFQAYAGLCSVRRAFLGAQVEIVNLHSKAKHEYVGYDRLNLKKQHVIPQRLVRHLLRQRRYRQCQKQFLEIDASQGFFTDSYDEAAEYLASQSYDLLLVGSDTVLNLYDWNHTAQEPPVYWLPPDLPGAKAMLAASIGTDLTLDALNEPMRQTLRRSADGFALLGVRDSMTRDFLLGLDPYLKPRIEVIPDPTFSLDIDHSHAERYLGKRGIAPEVPLIGLDLPMIVPGLREAIVHFRSKGYRVASWRGGSRIADCDFSDMTPFEWAGMFGRYAITLTNRFHASVFSLKNLTPVIAIDCKSDRVTDLGRSKVSLLLDDFGMKRTHYADMTSLLDAAWIRQAMESSLAEPRTEDIRKGLATKRSLYGAYLEDVYRLAAESDGDKTTGREVPRPVTRPATDRLES